MRFALLCLLLLSTTSLLADDDPFGGRHVLVIGIDGVRSDCLTKAETPHLDRLAREGAYSLDAFAGGVLGERTEQRTVSGPGWASILTGVWADKHSIEDNRFEEPDLEKYPNFFTRLRSHHAKASLASIVHWGPINEHIVTDADVATTVKTDAEVAERAVVLLRSGDPDVLFLHFDDVDHAGHATGFSPFNADYLTAIAKVDGHLGTILEAITARPRADDEEWLVVVTTDHGGFARGHGGQRPSERRIFFIAHGPGIQPGERSPGPGHTAVPPTVLRFLGVPIDEEWGWESEPFGYGE